MTFGTSGVGRDGLSDGCRRSASARRSECVASRGSSSWVQKAHRSSISEDYDCGKCTNTAALETVLARNT